MSVTATRPADSPPGLTDEEAYEIFERRCRERLGLTGEEFLRRWDAGELDVDDDDVIAVSMLLPLAR